MILIVCLIASLTPARRIIRVDLLEVLKAE
jgi:ABC-type lipoprotein release transport system permease subunit